MADSSVANAAKESAQAEFSHGLLVRMHPVPLRQFRNRRILAKRLERNLRLERRIKLLA
jgi:hypothetical protein